MIELYKQHILDEMTVPDILTYLCARVSSEEEELRRYRKQKRWFGEIKNIIQDLLDNSDEYARQRAIDFLEE